MHNRESSLPPPFSRFRLSPTTANLQKMQGRFFAGRRVEAHLYTGQQRFKRSKGEDDDMLGDGPESERKRLDDFAQWLLNEGEA